MSFCNIIACCLKCHVNSVGVLLTLIGAFLIWFFLAELNFADKAEYLKGRGVLEIPDPSPEQIRNFKKRICFSRLGLFLILIGGVLQIISNYL
jgi:hypothetical protein